MVRGVGKRLTTLSSLKLGTLYTLDAEEAKLTLRVVTEGQMPLCVIQGWIEEKLNSETDAPLVVQLLGWAPYGNYKELTNVELFTPDRMPHEDCWLIAMRMEDGAPAPFNLAISPKIKRAARA